MTHQFWTQVKSTYRLGELIHGKVEHHMPFGILVDLGDNTVRGIVQITDFVGYTEDDRNQVECEAKCVAKSLGASQDSSTGGS